MVYKIRVVLDCEEDVIRDIEINSNLNFEDLHNSISNYFDFKGKEMSSFYLCNDKWEQGQEIFLENFDKNELIMRETSLNSIVKDVQKKFLYVYDFLELWTFFVEIIEIIEKPIDYNYQKLIFSHGELPKIAPKKNFSIEKKEGFFNEDYDDEYY